MLKQIKWCLWWLKHSRGIPLKWRLYGLIRWATCPLQVFLDYVPNNATVYEAGCGIGLIGHLLIKQRKIKYSGFDTDDRKIRIATKLVPYAVLETGRRPAFSNSRSKFRVIIICDVLYLLNTQEIKLWLKRLIKQLEPGGTLLIKELTTQPRWKYKIGKVQERMSVGIGLTMSQKNMRIFSSEQLQAILSNSGLKTSQHPIDKGFMHPHRIYVCKKRS